MNQPENIMIYRLGSLGDTVIALPCFHLVRRRWPDAHVTLLTNAPVASKAASIEAILGRGYFFNDILNYPVGTRNPFRLLKLAFEIRRRRISTVVFMVAARGKLNVWRDRLFFRLAGIRHLVGAPAGESDFRLAPDAATGLFEWEASRLARRMAALGRIDLDSDEWWDLRLTEDEISRANDFLRIDPDQPFLAVSLGTKVPVNDWGQSNWTALLAALSRELKGWGLVLVGAAEEFDRCAGCAEAWAGPVINLCGKITPRESAAVLRQARLFVGHDSGPMHLAAVMGVPVVGIFAARNPPGLWYPRGRGNRIIYHQTDCFGCGLEVCEVERKKCILSISVPEALTTICEILNVKPTHPVPVSPRFS